jgi:hypothetical protein
MAGVVVSVALFSGCGAGALKAVRGQAAQEMPCPEAQVVVAPAVAGNGGPTESGVYYAQGCQKLLRYSVGCNVGGMCFVERGVDVEDVLRRQAAFDLKCGQANLAIQGLAADTFGVVGCDHQVSYLLRCSGQDCRVIQNTQSQ